MIRDGLPVQDIDVSALVLPHDNLEIYDKTRSRSDGTFELYVSSNELETDPFVSLVGWNSWDEVRGQQVVHVSPGGQRNGIELQIGPGVTVSGTVSDENGFPIPGLRVGEAHGSPEDWSTPTGLDGAFQLTIRRNR